MSKFWTFVPFLAQKFYTTNVLFTTFITVMVVVMMVMVVEMVLEQ
jgi:hypothetical protein